MIIAEVFVGQKDRLVPASFRSLDFVNQSTRVAEEFIHSKELFSTLSLRLVRALVVRAVAPVLFLSVANLWPAEEGVI